MPFRPVGPYAVKRMRRLFFTLLLGSLTFGCEGTIVGPGVDAPMALPPCDPILVPVARDLTVAPNAVAVVMVTGGTGRPRFALDSGGETGSRIDAETGVFVAGPDAGREAVRITDERCEDDAVVRIEITEALTLAPVTSEVAPGTSIAFEAVGGAGAVTFELARNSSGATLSASGAYVAGAVEADDRIRATDAGTGATAEATVRVRVGAGLTLAATRLGLPVGSSHALSTRGGSGRVDVTSSTPSFVVEGGAVTAMSAGDAMLTVTDHFTGMSVSVAASALASRTASSTWVGDRSEVNGLAVGDFDQDGRTDVAVALPGSNVAAYRAGAVYLFGGTAGGGLMGRPARVLTGIRREDAFGSAVTVADLDGDGVVELLVGVWQDDSVGSNAGAVLVYQGVPGRFFDDAPYLSLYGVSANDRFGLAVTACDFDGDGDVDLAVGAADDEDNSIVPALSNQGAVHVFSSYGGRILGRADNVLFGAVPDGAGGFTSHANLRFGSAVGSGDIDGDGLCDLVVHAQRPDPLTASDGAVSVYRGLAAPAGRPEGSVAAEPSVVWAAMEAGDRGSRLGAYLAVGDLDDDGLAEIAAGAPSHDRPMMGSEPAVSDLGAVRVFAGAALADRATALTPATASALFLEGSGSSALLGHGVAIGDVDGDRLLDLVVAQSRAMPMGSELTRPGIVAVHAGVRGAMPATTPVRTVVGTGNDERFGNGLAVLGQGGVAILAPYADAEGTLDVGRLYASAPSSLTPVELEGRASGRRLGQSVAIVGDVTGDGIDDLVVGAPHQPDPTGMRRGMDYGAAYLYAGDGAGFSVAPTATLGGYTFSSSAGHSESDWLGEVVSSAGDFDGDGRDDVAVVARFEDLPAAFDPAAWTVDPACGTTARNNVGAVLVYSGVASGGSLSQPSLVFFGTQADRTVQMVAGDLDVNGDGLDDLIVGGANWLSTDAAAERRGGYAIVFGRARGATGSVVCTPDARFEGAVVNDELGTSAARIGDLDGDGCDEVAIGVPKLDRPGVTDEGGVHVLFGFGPACASPTARSIVLVPSDRTSWAGTALAGGVDLDGGGVPDLVVGAPRYASPRGEVGRVYLLSGERIRMQAGASAPVAFASVAPSGTWYVDGQAAGERLGWSLAIVGAIAGPRYVAMGGIYANLGGVPNSGGARVYSVTAGGFAGLHALVSGETASGYPELGASLAARGPTLAIGASWGSGDAVEEGSAYVFRP